MHTSMYAVTLQQGLCMPLRDTILDHVNILQSLRELFLSSPLLGRRADLVFLPDGRRE